MVTGSALTHRVDYSHSSPVQLSLLTGPSPTTHRSGSHSSQDLLTPHRDCSHSAWGLLSLLTGTALTPHGDCSHSSWGLLSLLTETALTPHRDCSHSSQEPLSLFQGTTNLTIHQQEKDHQRSDWTRLDLITHTCPHNTSSVLSLACLPTSVQRPPSISLQDPLLATKAKFWGGLKFSKKKKFIINGH